MAEVSRMLPQTQMTASYFPAIPPKAPKTSISYSLALNEAPYKSLIGILPEQRIPDKLSIETKYRIRNQTGLTNRWRHPDCLYSDLLGNSQALKSISMPYNTNLIKIITGRSKVMPDDKRDVIETAIKQERQAYHRRFNRKADEAFPKKAVAVAVVNKWDDSSDSDDDDVNGF